MVCHSNVSAIFYFYIYIYLFATNKLQAAVHTVDIVVFLPVR